MMTELQVLRPGSRIKATGSLLSGSPDGLWAWTNDGRGVRVRGLFVGLEGSNAAAPNAVVTLRVGRPGGAAQAVRTFTLPTGGVWLSCAGWNTVELVVDELPAGGAVSYAWLREQPPNSYPLMLVQAVAAGAHVVPPGAVAVAVGTADAAWTWHATSAAATVTLAAPQLADGARRPVLGAAYTAAVPNQLSWELAPL